MSVLSREAWLDAVNYEHPGSTGQARGFILWHPWVEARLEVVNYEHSGSRGRDFKISFWGMPWRIGKTSFKRYVSSSFGLVWPRNPKFTSDAHFFCCLDRGQAGGRKF